MKHFYLHKDYLLQTGMAFNFMTGWRRSGRVLQRHCIYSGEKEAKMVITLSISSCFVLIPCCTCASLILIILHTSLLDLDQKIGMATLNMEYYFDFFSLCPFLIFDTGYCHLGKPKGLSQSGQQLLAINGYPEERYTFLYLNYHQLV